MEEHLRFAIAYWHSFCGDGTDQFVMLPIYTRGKILQAMTRSNKDLTLLSSLLQIGAPLYCFHDADVVGGDGSVFDIERRLEKYVPVMKKCRIKQV